MFKSLRDMYARLTAPPPKPKTQTPREREAINLTLLQAVNPGLEYKQAQRLLSKKRKRRY